MFRVPTRLTAMSFSHWAGSVLAKGRNTSQPALLTSTSIGRSLARQSLSRTKSWREGSRRTAGCGAGSASPGTAQPRRLRRRPGEIGREAQSGQTARGAGRFPRCPQLTFSTRAAGEHAASMEREGIARPPSERTGFLARRERECPRRRAANLARANLKLRLSRRSGARVSEGPRLARLPVMREVLRCSTKCPKRGV